MLRPIFAHMRARPRMATAIVLGISTGVLMPADTPLVTRCLTGWDLGVWTYLALMAWLMARADHGHLYRLARAQSDKAVVVLVMVVTAAVASLVALGYEMAQVHQAGASHAASRLALTAITVIGAWLLMPVVFTMTYASHYHRSADQTDGGLIFPDTDPAFRPGFSDFLYFSFTIAVAAQTADIAVSNRHMRQLVLLQSVLAFAFNAAILSLAINIAAGLF